MSISILGTELPHLRTAIPGPASREWVTRLARHECPAITARRARRAVAIGAADTDPIVWSAARGAVVEDADGNRLVDLTSGFGVAFVGHRHPDVVRAATAQTERLIHAMGDAFPDVARIALLEKLSAVAPGDLSVAILGSSGSDAVEAAVKTAVLATGRHGVLTFGGGYHGLSIGNLALQGYKAAFADPFRPMLHPRVTQLPWGASLDAIEAALSKQTIGLVLLEPIQGRGGIRTAPDGWLAGVGERARASGALVALDEIYTGLGRTGAWFAGPQDGLIPDLLCVGKALAGGFPLSACLGTPAVMDTWGASTGEALHTQTFLGHPVGCAAALAVLQLLEREDLPALARTRGERLRRDLEAQGLTVRGRGLMLGIELPEPGPLAACRALLERGFITLPAGMNGEVLALSPPVTLTDAQADAFVAALVDVVAQGRP